jgi:dihydropteroate synthase
LVVASIGATRIGGRVFDWGSRTFLMGVINVTPDSFSGDGLLDPVSAVDRARAMEAEGADLIDVGAESTRPQTWTGPGLPLADELDRLLPVLEALVPAVAVPVSVDTYKAAVAEAAAGLGAAMINDVFGLKRDPGMAAVVARAGLPVVLMHNGVGASSEAVMADVEQGLRESMALARAAGIAAERIVLDPGIGFGKTREQNLEIIRRLHELRRLGRPLLVGPSRKSFIGNTLGLEAGDRLEGTAASVALAIAGGADLVRVHDVRAMARVARMADAIVRAPG